MIWSRSEQWMLTGDDKGYIKYWQANMNNVKMFQGHIEAIRGLRYKLTTKLIVFLLLFFLFVIQTIKLPTYHHNFALINKEKIVRISVLNNKIKKAHKEPNFVIFLYF